MWRTFKPTEHIVLGSVLLLVAAVTLTRLPPGVCFSDSGDLQLASSTLGIMHPTGYPGYATIGYLVTRIPGVDPAYLVTLTCWTSGIVVLWLAMLMQMRLGVSAWLAGTTTLILTAHPRIWTALIVPEVYLPTLALVAAAAYLLIRFTHHGKRKDLLPAALLFGFALANRPPVLFFFPFFATAWWLGRNRWDVSWRRSAASLSLSAACIAGPCLFSFAYLWLRDRPDATYNYIEQHNARLQVLPEASAGAGAKLERVIWQASGRQFRHFMGTSWRETRMKILWLRHELLPPHQQYILALAWLIVLFGVVVTLMRCRASAVLLAGMLLASTVFVCLYRLHGQAADLLPLLFAATILGGVAISILLPHEQKRAPYVAISLAAAVATLTVTGAPNRVSPGKKEDARPFLTELDIQSLPPRTAICVEWRLATPLWYARSIRTHRTDLDILCTDDGGAIERALETPDRLILVGTKTPGVKGYTTAPYRNLWRLIPKETT